MEQVFFIVPGEKQEVDPQRKKILETLLPKNARFIIFKKGWQSEVWGVKPYVPGPFSSESIEALFGTYHEYPDPPLREVPTSNINSSISSILAQAEISNSIAIIYASLGAIRQLGVSMDLDVKEECVFRVTVRVGESKKIEDHLVRAIEVIKIEKICPMKKVIVLYQTYLPRTIGFKP